MVVVRWGERVSVVVLRCGASAVVLRWGGLGLMMPASEAGDDYIIEFFGIFDIPPILLVPLFERERRHPLPLCRPCTLQNIRRDPLVGHTYLHPQHRE